MLLKLSVRFAGREFWARFCKKNCIDQHAVFPPFAGYFLDISHIVPVVRVRASELITRGRAFGNGNAAVGTIIMKTFYGSSFQIGRDEIWQDCFSSSLNLHRLTTSDF